MFKWLVLPVVGRQSFKIERLSKSWEDDIKYKVTSSCCPDFLMQIDFNTGEFKVIEPYRKKLAEYHPHILDAEDKFSDVIQGKYT